MSAGQPNYKPDQVDQPEEAQPVAQKPRRSRKSDSAFKTISEVADTLDVQQHVLRFWETKFSQIKPLKRGGGRRYYRPEDLELLRSIHHLLYTEGYTIKGVQKLLKEKGKSSVVQNNKPMQAQAVAEAAQKQVQPQSSGLSNKNKAVLEAMLTDLRELRGLFVAD